jgi:hypothetical protein
MRAHWGVAVNPSDCVLERNVSEFVQFRCTANSSAFPDRRTHANFSKRFPRCGSESSLHQAGIFDNSASDLGTCVETESRPELL